MIIKLFETSKEFFDAMYSPFVDDISENEVIREKQDEEKCWQESSMSDFLIVLYYNYI